MNDNMNDTLNKEESKTNTETHRTYHDNGKLKEEIELVNGERNGYKKCTNYEM